MASRSGELSSVSRSKEPTRRTRLWPTLWWKIERKKNSICCCNKEKRLTIQVWNDRVAVSRIEQILGMTDAPTRDVYKCKLHDTWNPSHWIITYTVYTAKWIPIHSINSIRMRTAGFFFCGVLGPALRKLHKNIRLEKFFKLKHCCLFSSPKQTKIYLEM